MVDIAGFAGSVVTALLKTEAVILPLLYANQDLELLCVLVMHSRHAICNNISTW
jgi:hypothetical protein